MANPQINFRLSPYQIARGLRILRRLEPTYQFTSIHQIIKDCYLDYIAKMSIGTDDQILFQDIEEINLKILSKVKSLTINELAKLLSPANFSPPPKQSEALEKLVSSRKHESCKTDESCKEDKSRKEDTSSEISTVSDFSPPSSWLDEEDSTPTTNGDSNE